MSYSFKYRTKCGGDTFKKRMLKNIAGVNSILFGVGLFLTLGFCASAVTKGYNRNGIFVLVKEKKEVSLLENMEKDELEQYNLASVMLFTQLVEENSTIAINELANEKREQRIREEEKKRAAEEARRKKLEEKKRKEQQQKTQKAEATSRGGYSVSKSELDLLEKIVMAEAGAEPYEGKIAVVNVIMNRVAHKSYPNTIKGVVFQKGQFTPARNGRVWKMKPTAEVKKAVKEALNGKRVVGKDVLYFLNPDIAKDQTIPRTKKFVKRIGGHAFYK